MTASLRKSLLATSLVLASGMALASEPMQLTEQQMDAVSAGQFSTASGWAYSSYGTASSRTTTSAYSWGIVSTTQASVLSFASGPGSSTAATASSSL